MKSDECVKPPQYCTSHQHQTRPPADVRWGVGEKWFRSLYSGWQKREGGNGTTRNPSLPLSSHTPSLTPSTLFLLTRLPSHPTWLINSYIHTYVHTYHELITGTYYSSLQFLGTKITKVDESDGRKMWWFTRGREKWRDNLMVNTQDWLVIPSSQ